MERLLVTWMAGVECAEDKTAMNDADHLVPSFVRQQAAEFQQHQNKERAFSEHQRLLRLCRNLFKDVI